jgi:hypothetical protein
MYVHLCSKKHALINEDDNSVYGGTLHGDNIITMC